MSRVGSYNFAIFMRMKEWVGGERTDVILNIKETELVGHDERDLGEIVCAVE